MSCDETRREMKNAVLSVDAAVAAAVVAAAWIWGPVSSVQVSHNTHINSRQLPHAQVQYMRALTRTQTRAHSRVLVCTHFHTCVHQHTCTRTRAHMNTQARAHTHTHTRTHLEESKKSGCHSTMSWNPCRWLSPSITNIWNVPSTLYSNSFQQNTYWSKFDEKSAEQKRTVFSSLE